jgi:putative FmdB family regulatory protein
MPVYDYECEDCGPFTVMRPMSECDAPHDCPDCGAAAARAWLTAPNFSTMSAERRVAHATNERSSHAPTTSADYKAKHGSGCSCCSGKKTSRFVNRSKTGSKSFPSSRPWMISH